MPKSLVSFLSTTEVWVFALGLASFLALFWVLRGAPVGQAVRDDDEADAPRGGYRDRVVAAVCLGMMLILTGAYLALTRGVAWSIPAFVLGFGTVVSLVLINQRYRHGSPTLRRTVDLASASLNASLFAGVLVVLNVVAFRYGGRAIDMTRERAYSLSTLTVAQLTTLNRPVTFTTFFGRSGAANQQRDRVQQMLDLYKAENPSKITLDHVDPFRDLPRYEELVKRVPDVDVTQGGGVVIEYGEGTSADRVVIRNADLFAIPRSPQFDPNVEKFQADFKGEDAVTSALIRLREGKRSKIVFTTGHGEPPLEQGDSAHPSLGLWKSRLTANGSEVFGVNLFTQDVPEDAALVVIVGPTSPFKTEEVDRLKAYVLRKGPVLALVGESDPTGLDAFLKGFGVEVGKGFAVEPRLNVRGRPDAVVLPVVNQRQPIVEPLNNQVVVLLKASPLTVEAAPANPAAAAFSASPLLKTSPESWAETDPSTRQVRKDREDTPGPLTVAAYVTDRPKPGDAAPPAARLVVFSSRYVGDNAVLQSFPPNLDLLMNAVNWLRGRADLQGIAPNTHEGLSLTADQTLAARLILVPTVMSVLLILTFGVATYLARRE